MADYIRHTWEDGEVIDADKLNNLEEGVSKANQNMEQITMQFAMKNHTHRPEQVGIYYVESVEQIAAMSGKQVGDLFVVAIE